MKNITRRPVRVCRNVLLVAAVIAPTGCGDEAEGVTPVSPVAATYSPAPTLPILENPPPPAPVLVPAEGEMDPVAAPGPAERPAAAPGRGAAAAGGTAGRVQAAASEGPKNVEVSLTLIQMTGYDVDEGEGPEDACRGGHGGYDDIGPGSPVTVRDGAKAVIGTGTLTRSRFEESGRDQTPVPPNDDATSDWGPVSSWPTHTTVSGFCTYVGDVDVPASEFYSFEVSHRGESVKSRAQLEQAGWKVSLSLG